MSTADLAADDEQVRPEEVFKVAQEGVKPLRPFGVGQCQALFDCGRRVVLGFLAFEL